MPKTISSTPPMQDIPLSATEEHGDSVIDSNKSGGNSKTNSLKRFFKLPSNRGHSSGEEMQTGSSEATPEVVQKSKGAENEGEKCEEVENLKKDQVDKTNSDSFASEAPSRQSLKNSITGYWHTVFKKASGKKNSKGKSEQNRGDECDFEAVTNVTELNEDVQMLTISEDTVEQVINALE